jgi:hypothetical protein
MHLLLKTQRSASLVPAAMDYGDVFEKLLVTSVILGLFGAVGGVEPVSLLNTAFLGMYPGPDASLRRSRSY